MNRVWPSDVAVLVCGVENGQVTEDGGGIQRFVDLTQARAVFPDLDPSKNTSRFTWAIGNPERDEMRFETFAACRLYSA